MKKEKDNFKKVILYLITIILCVFVGCAGMYFLIMKYPNVILKTITTTAGTTKKVTVIDEGISEGIKNIQDSVVTIEAYQNNKIVSTGSGFIYKVDGKNTYIMTNHHVTQSYKDVKVTLRDKSEVSATIVGSDEYSDISVLKIETRDGIHVATISTKLDIEVGDTVFAIGSPMGKDYAGTATRGIISGKDRMVSISSSNYTTSSDYIMNVMQTDAAINPGNSGGPLCNASGEVIGINSMKIVESSVEGIGFAIPITDAIIYASSIEKEGKVVRAYLGIYMLDATETYMLARQGIELDDSVDSGVVVVSTEAGGPAAKAGLKMGDVIYKIGKNQINNTAELRYYLYQNLPGDKIDISFYRNGKTKTINIVLKESES